MIRALLFDFDGVILESADIKTEAFRELFRGYPEKIEAITNYHLFNGGLSRYVKLRYIYNRILGMELSGEKEVGLARDFSGIVVEKVLAAPFVDGARKFLDEMAGRYRAFIVSGTPTEELDVIIRARGLSGFFEEVHGSPAAKVDLINDILRRHGFGREEAVYVGDAESDRIAAEKTKIAFIKRGAGPEAGLKKDPRTIRDLRGLEKALGEIESQDALMKLRKERVE